MILELLVHVARAILLGRDEHDKVAGILARDGQEDERVVVACALHPVALVARILRRRRLVNLLERLHHLVIVALVRKVRIAAHGALDPDVAREDGRHALAVVRRVRDVVAQHVRRVFLVRRRVAPVGIRIVAHRRLHLLHRLPGNAHRVERVEAHLARDRHSADCRCERLLADAAVHRVQLLLLLAEILLKSSHLLPETLPVRVVSLLNLRPLEIEHLLERAHDGVVGVVAARLILLSHERAERFQATLQNRLILVPRPVVVGIFDHLRPLPGERTVFAAGGGAHATLGAQRFQFANVRKQRGTDGALVGPIGHARRVHALLLARGAPPAGRGGVESADVGMRNRHGKKVEPHDASKGVSEISRD